MRASNLGEALKEAGFDQFRHQAQAAAANFIKAGGTREQWIAAYDAATRMSGMGQAAGADDGPSTIAQTRQLMPSFEYQREGLKVEDGGARVTVPTGHVHVVPSSSPNHDERSHELVAGIGHTTDAPSRREPDRGGDGHRKRAPGQSTVAIPVREPTQQQRTASHAAAKVAAITIMDTLKIDGIAIGNWTVARARVEGKRKTREGYILSEAVKLVANAPSTALLRNVVKMSEMQRIRQKAEEIADAV